MGLFKKQTTSIKAMQKAKLQGLADGRAAVAAAMAGPAPTPSAFMEGMQREVVYAELANKLGRCGIEAPGVIHAIRHTGDMTLGGGEYIKLDVSIKPATGEAYQATVTQAFVPVQLEGMTEGQPITVKYDPDAPVMALIYDW
jgi:hypothetical protein